MKKEKITMCNTCDLVHYNLKDEEVFCSMEGRLVAFGVGALKCIIDLPLWCPMYYHPNSHSLPAK